MTIAVFTFSLLGAMALGMPIAYALIVCGVALMLQIGMFDSQIIAQNIINGADSFPLLAVPFFMLAGELMNAGGLAKRIVNVALTMIGSRQGRSGLRSNSCFVHAGVAVGFGRRRCRRTGIAARADDGVGRP
jgi:TRAP-type transport system large permease protein